MEIIKTSTENKVDIYKLTQDAAIQSMKDSKGQLITVKEWAHYTDTDKDGNTREIISIMDNDGVVRATNSATFRKDFLNMVDLFGQELASITVLADVSKNNREFITCSLADVKATKKK